MTKSLSWPVWAAVVVAACAPAPQVVEKPTLFQVVLAMRIDSGTAAAPFQPQARATNAPPATPWCAELAPQNGEPLNVCSPDGTPQTVGLLGGRCYETSIRVDGYATPLAQTSFCLPGESAATEFRVDSVIYKDALALITSFDVSPTTVKPADTISVAWHADLKTENMIETRIVSPISGRVFWTSGKLLYTNPAEAQYEIQVQNDWPATNVSTGSAFEVQVVLDDVVKKRKGFVVLTQDSSDVTEPTGGGDPAPDLACHVMVKIPAGTFWRGCAPTDTRCASDELPGKTVYLDDYWIDANEVTVSAYQQCVEAGACSSAKVNGYEVPGVPYTLDDACNYGKTDRANHPMNCVTWDEATAYCTWAGKRLPTEAEWEKAKRGATQDIFQWGADAIPPAEAGNFADTYFLPYTTVSITPNYDGWKIIPGYEDGAMLTAPVCSYTNEGNPYGLRDMTGNVWERLLDWYSASFYSSPVTMNPVNTTPNSYRTLRGGGLNYTDYYLRTSFRSKDQYGSTGTNRVNHTGFRCVDDVQP